MIPLPILTYLFYDYVEERFGRLGNVLSIEQAQTVDEILAKAKASSPSNANTNNTNNEVKADAPVSAAAAQPAAAAASIPSGDGDLKVEVEDGARRMSIAVSATGSGHRDRIHSQPNLSTKIIHGGMHFLLYSFLCFACDECPSTVMFWSWFRCG